MNFFKTLVAATLGTIIAVILAFFIIILVIVSSSREPEPNVEDHSVLKISLSGSLPAQTHSNPLNKLLDRTDNDKVSLETLKENLRKALADENINGIWLNINFMSEGWANLEEAHQMLRAFRDSSDKFIYASTNDLGFNEKGYYLATAADSVFSPPETFFEFDGFYTQVMFLDGMFEKLGIDAEVTRHGKYKGAVEPFFRKDLSEANKYQLNQLLDQVNTTFISAVSAKSGKSIETLNSLLNEQPHLSSTFGIKQNLIDSTMYPDQVEEFIKKRIDVDKKESLSTISNNRYAKISTSSAGVEPASTSDKIAVIYANGPIMPQANSGSPFNSQQYITTEFVKEQLEDIREDDDIKALVMRVNSPGGAGTTSDLIWHMLQETKKNIPVIISMGDVAASGGYYISAAADSIVAQPTTITGSIGVFATKFNAKQLFNKKLGLTFDGVKTHDHADWLTLTRSFTPSEQKVFQQYVDQFYQTFISRVADSRAMTKEQVDELGQGRVWTGADAKENGLVDILGGLGRALEIAAEKADIKDFKLERFPKEKSFYELVMQSVDTQVQAFIKDTWLSAPEAQHLKNKLTILKHRGALTLFPFEINIQ